MSQASGFRPLLLPDCADLNITSTNIAVINNAVKPKGQCHFALTFPRDSCFIGFFTRLDLGYQRTNILLMRPFAQTDASTTTKLVRPTSISEKDRLDTTWIIALKASNGFIR